MVANLIDFLRRKASIDQNRPGIEAGRRQKKSHKDAAVFADEHHPVAWADARLRKPSLGVVDGHGQLAVRPGAALFDQRRMIR